MNDMSVRDVFALVILMGLFLSTASGHQKAYTELLAYVDAGNALTLDDVQHAMIRRTGSPHAASIPLGLTKIRRPFENLMRVGCDSTDDDAD
jgi:hypothetical protein